MGILTTRNLVPFKSSSFQWIIIVVDERHLVYLFVRSTISPSWLSSVLISHFLSKILVRTMRLYVLLLTDSLVILLSDLALLFSMYVWCRINLYLLLIGSLGNLSSILINNYSFLMGFASQIYRSSVDLLLQITEVVLQISVSALTWIPILVCL